MNLVKNVGLGEESTHSNLSLNSISKEMREVFYCDAQEIEFPLKHPKYVFENVLYKESLFKLTGKGHPLISFKKKIVSIVLRVKNGDFKSIINGVKRRLGIK